MTNKIKHEQFPEIVRGKITVTRDDGLKVFLDEDDTELNIIRKNAPKKIVIAAVAIRRAQQIAHNYAEKYAPELLHEFNITPLIDNRRFRKYLTGGVR